MLINIINYKLILSLCILLVIAGCNNQNKKLIVENKQTNLIKKTTKSPINKTFAKNKILKNEIIVSNEKPFNVQKNENVIFEFKNERLLQGREVLNKQNEKKTEKALTAVLKMFRKNVTSNQLYTDINENNELSKVDNYSHEINEVLKYKNILAFLPLTGRYSNFGTKIRKAIDLSILNFGSNNLKIIYFDTGKKVEQKNLTSLFEEISPNFVIGPFTREVLLKIKPLAKINSIPLLTFSNDIAMVENNVWSLGFSPEEQVERVISCALIHGYKNFGVIAPDNLYGKIITRHSLELVSVSKQNKHDNVFLSNEQLNNKPKLYSILRKFLEYSKTQTAHSKFDSILLGGSKEFILEIAPLLAFFNVDSRSIKILGTEKFNIKEIKNEPSLKKSWFPIIASENDDQFNLLWKEIWGGNTNYFTNVGFDSGFWGINYTQKLSNSLRYLSKTKGPVTGLILNKNGLVVKPTQVLQIENLGKTKIIQKCSKSKHQSSN